MVKTKASMFLKFTHQKRVRQGDVISFNKRILQQSRNLLKVETIKQISVHLFFGNLLTYSNQIHTGLSKRPLCPSPPFYIQHGSSNFHRQPAFHEKHDFRKMIRY